MTNTDAPIRNTDDVPEGVAPACGSLRGTTVASVLERLGSLAVASPWDVSQRTALNTLVARLCHAVPAAAIVTPNPGDSVALHLRILGLLAARTCGSPVELDATTAREVEELLVVLA